MTIAYCVVFFVLFYFRFVSCVPNVASFYGLSVLDSPFSFI